MKRIKLLVAALTAVLTGAFAQTSDNFNSRPAAVLADVKNYLQNHCWQFTDFAINQGGWTPAIEGDGAMVSGTSANSTQATGIYSQMLSMGGNLNLSFKYKFNAAVTDRRWVKIALVDKNNVLITKLDSIELTGAAASTVYNFNKNYNVGSGCFKVYINYQGVGGSTRIAIDQLAFSSNTCYPGGCNQAPVAVNDNVAGNALHGAAGNVLPNDYDPNNEMLSATLITNSNDGNVALTSYGTFIFTPNPGFSGNSTSFTYLVCDNGAGPLCSNTATVNISFPAQGSLPVSIIDFNGIYNDNKVTVRWTTTFEIKHDYFEVERSTDGINFKAVGKLKGNGNSSVNKDYSFDDQVKNNMINKNDLYYRLRQVDQDGNSSYSKILVVRVYQTKSLQSVSVTPNPAVNEIKVNVQLNESSYVVMRVLNNNGVEVLRKSTRAGNGPNSFTVEGSNQLKPGIYMLEVTINSNERMIVKLVKS